LSESQSYIDAVTQPPVTPPPVPPPRVTSVVATTYVRDLTASREFYGALGFVEQVAGANATAGWSYLRHADHFLLLATSEPPLAIPRLPLLFYFFVDDLTVAVRAVEAAGATVELVGHPPHAKGGEARTTDPDDNTVLLGQAERSSGQAPVESDPSRHFSLLREAAALAEHREGGNMSCDFRDLDDRRCTRPAEVKLADSWGDTAWACLTHAETVLINAPSAFIASQADRGLRDFLASQRRPRTP
jgi:catechol 2,3-dioxygenase-like lactoylglutathione lyase family enzyme